MSAATSWAWTFGDGGTSTAQNPSHTYTTAGHYTVTLVATNSAGSDTETKTAYITVTAPEVAGFAVAFDNDPMDPDPDWDRIDNLAGCRVRSWTIDRGRPTEFDKTDVGTAVVQIVDRDGLFDPTNTGSPYAGKILPGKQAAVAMINPVNDTWHTLFRGFVESWHYRLSPLRDHMELELQLVDGFAILARAMLEVGVDGALPPFDDVDEDGNPLFSEDQKDALEELAAGNVLYGETELFVGGPTGTGTVSDRIQAILGDVGWPLTLREQAVDIFSGNVRVGPKAYGPGTSALDALWDCADAEFPGVANFWISAGGPDPPGDRAGHLVFHGRQARFRPDVAEYRINRFTVGDPSGWSLAADPDLEVVPIAELEWSLGSDNLFNACSATPQGVGSGSLWRQLDPERDDIAGQYVTDPASIAAYGLRSLTFDQLQTVQGIHDGANSMQETRKFAEYYVANFAAPTSRISRLVFKAKQPSDPHAPALWKFLCTVDISDLLTVKTEHGGGGGFDHVGFFVEGLHYTARPGSPDVPQIVELSLDVSPQAHWDTNVFDEDPDPEPA